MNCKLHFYQMFRREWVSGFYKIKSIPLSNINIEYSKQSNFNKGPQFPTFNYKHRKHLQKIKMFQVADPRKQKHSIERLKSLWK